MSLMRTIRLLQRAVREREEVYGDVFADFLKLAPTNDNKVGGKKRSNSVDAATNYADKVCLFRYLVFLKYVSKEMI